MIHEPVSIIMNEILLSTLLIHFIIVKLSRLSEFLLLIRSFAIQDKLITSSALAISKRKSISSKFQIFSFLNLWLMITFFHFLKKCWKISEFLTFALSTWRDFRFVFLNSEWRFIHRFDQEWLTEETKRLFSLNNLLTVELRSFKRECRFMTINFRK